MVLVVVVAIFAPGMATLVLVFPLFALMSPMLTAPCLLSFNVITPLLQNRCLFVIDGNRFVIRWSGFVDGSSFVIRWGSLVDGSRFGIPRCQTTCRVSVVN